MYHFLSDLRHQKRRRATLAIRSTCQNWWRALGASGLTQVGCAALYQLGPSSSRAVLSRKVRKHNSIQSAYAVTACRPVGFSLASLERGLKNTACVSRAVIASWRQRLCLSFAAYKPLKAHHRSVPRTKYDQQCVLQLRKFVARKSDASSQTSLCNHAVACKPFKVVFSSCALALSARAGLSLPCPGCCFFPKAPTARGSSRWLAVSLLARCCRGICMEQHAIAFKRGAVS